MSRQIYDRRVSTAKENLLKAKKITAGVFFSAGEVYLSPAVLKKVVEIRENKERDLEEKRIKLEIRKLKVAQKVDDILTRKGLLPSKWNVDEIRSCVGYLKWDGDEKIPSKKNDLLERLYKTVST